MVQALEHQEQLTRALRRNSGAVAVYAEQPFTLMQLGRYRYPWQPPLGVNLDRITVQILEQLAQYLTVRLDLGQITHARFEPG